MSDLPYRQGANALVLDSNNYYLLVQKVSYDENQWDFPGGGIEEGDTPEEAVLKELEEELGSTKFSIIRESPIKIRFDWPKEDQKRGYLKHGKWWRGQEKHQFIIKFDGDKESLVLQKEEINRIKWVPYSELKNHLVFNGQWENAKKVIEEYETFLHS